MVPRERGAESLGSADQESLKESAVHVGPEFVFSTIHHILGVVEQNIQRNHYIVISNRMAHDSCAMSPCAIRIRICTYKMSVRQ